MISRTTIDAMIQRARDTQAKVSRGELQGTAPAVVAECRETLATIDAYLLTLPAADRSKVSRELVTALEAPAQKFQSTVQPKRRVQTAARL